MSSWLKYRLMNQMRLEETNQNFKKIPSNPRTINKTQKQTMKLMEHVNHGHCRNGLILGLVGVGLILGVDIGVNLLHWGLVLVGANTVLSDD